MGYINSARIQIKLLKPDLVLALSMTPSEEASGLARFFARKPKLKAQITQIPQMNEAKRVSGGLLTECRTIIPGRSSSDTDNSVLGDPLLFSPNLRNRCAEQTFFDFDIHFMSPFSVAYPSM